MKPTLVILAAGAGSRYGGLKQLAPIGPGGEALLEYSSYDAMRAGFGKVVIVIRPEAEPEFRQRLDRGVGSRIPTVYVHQTLAAVLGDAAVPSRRVKPWGTGHAVLAAEAAIGGPFAVINADDFYGRESFEVLFRALGQESHDSTHRLALVAFEVAQTLTDAGPVSRAVCHLNSEGRLGRIVELGEVWQRNGRIVYRDGEGVEQTLGGDELVSMNMWGFTPRLFRTLRNRLEDFMARAGADPAAEFLLPDVVQSLIGREHCEIEVLRGSGRWCGITFREDERRVAATIANLVDEGSYPKELWA